jgi:hypothetical protein
VGVATAAATATVFGPALVATGPVVPAAGRFGGLTAWTAVPFDIGVATRSSGRQSVDWPPRADGVPAGEAISVGVGLGLGLLTPEPTPNAAGAPDGEVVVFPCQAGCAILGHLVLHVRASGRHTCPLPTALAQ